MYVGDRFVGNSDQLSFPEKVVTKNTSQGVIERKIFRDDQPFDRSNKGNFFTVNPPRLPLMSVQSTDR